MSQIEVAGGTDQVMVGFPIPAGGTLKNVWIKQRVIGVEGQEYRHACMYGVSGFVIPVIDPDAGTTFEAIWDAQVPKDTDNAVGAFDLDTAGADTDPEFEIGTPDINALFDLTGLAPEEIFRRRTMLTLPDSPIGYEKVSAAVDVFTPVDKWDSQVKRNVRVDSPAVVLFGFSSPDVAATTATVKAIPSEVEWVLLQFMEMTLEQAFIHLIGLVESGAQTPYVEAAAFVAELIEDSVYEETATSFNPQTYRVYTQATFEIEVPGTVSQKVLSSE